MNNKRKNILYIHQYFKTPNEPGGTRSYWIARKMIKEGYNVTILTSSGEIKSNILIKKIDNINVIYLKIPYNQNMSILKRFFSFLNFSIQSLIQLYKLRKSIYKVYATSTPLSVAIPALFAYFFLNKKFLFEVRDLWPEVPIQMGAIKNPIIISILKKIEYLTYQNADKIITLSPGMYDGVIQTGIQKDKVYMIPNMSKPDDFFPRKKNNLILKKYNINKSNINIIYFGSIGKSNGLELVFDFFFKIRKRNIRLFVCGEGSEKTN